MIKSKRKQGRADVLTENERPTVPADSDVNSDSTSAPEKSVVRTKAATPQKVVTLADREVTVNIFIRAKPGELPKAFATTEKATHGMKKRTVKQWQDRYAAWLKAPR